MEVQTIDQMNEMDRNYRCDYCQQTGFEPCTQHVIAADGSCDWCGTPEITPPRISCRCQD